MLQAASIIRAAFGVVLVLALLAAPVFPQASNATVSGTVRDQSGAPIPAASVTLTNKNTNVASSTKTNQVGSYVFPGTLPGPYTLTAESPGMQRFEGSLQVQVQQSAVVDVVLRVGQTATEVSVVDVTPLVQTGNATLGHVLERTRIEQLPINGRAVTNLLQTVPGMEGTRAFGLREGSYEISLDGSSLIDRNYGGVFNRQPGLDSIQEFKVENNSSSAKFTRPTSLILTTKSGTNSFHGAAFETNRNNAIGLARQRQDTFTKAPFLNRNEFGASAGAPVYIPKVYNGKDRTFWFFAYEALRQINPATQQWNVPTQQMRDGNFSELVDNQGRLSVLYDPWSTNTTTWARVPFTNNTIPQSRQSPLSKTLIGITPPPTNGLNPNLDFNWIGPVPRFQRSYTVTTRIDHRVTEKDQFYGRYTHGNFRNFSQFYSMPMPLNDPVPGTNQTLAPNKALALSWVRSISPTFYNELLVSGARQDWFAGTGDPNRKYSNELGLPNPLDVFGWPGLYDGGLQGRYYFETNNTQASPNFYAIVDNNATKIMGRHEFQFGFHYRYDQLNLLPDQQQNQGNHSWATGATALYDTASSRTNPLAVVRTGDNLANQYLGIMNYSNQFVRGYFYARSKEYALYFQDNFRVNSRLTLNLGMRWEYWPAFREKNNVLTGFDPASKSIVLGTPLERMYTLGATLPAIVNRYTSLGAKFTTFDQVGLPQGLMTTPKNDFGPRVGVAYRMGDGARPLVIRSGFRISYFHIPTRPWVARMRSNAPLTARFRTSLTDASLTPDGIGGYGFRSVPTIIAGQNSQNAVTLDTAAGLNRGSASASYFARNQPDARVADWNFTIEKEIMGDTVARIGLVGNRSSNLEQFYRYNVGTPDYIHFVTTRNPLPTGEFAAVARNPFDAIVYGNIEEYRMTGWGNYSGVQMELERRWSNGVGFQLFYVVGNTIAAGGQGFGGTSIIPEVNQFLPGTVPTDIKARNRLINYQRDTTVPKHRVRWNWIVDLPFGKGKKFGGSASGVVDKLIGGWQIAGIGNIRSNFVTLPTGIYPTGEKLEVYGYKYPIEDCTSGTCYPGYLWYNGYIPANRINSVDANGRPNGIMGVPANYKPAASFLIPWGSTAMPANAPAGTVVSQFWDTNSVWIPLNNGSIQRTNYNDGLHPWRQQYIPSVRQWELDSAVYKSIPIRESMQLRFNVDFFNILNNPNNPIGIAQTGILSTRNSGGAPRVIQLTGRFIW
jgi:hypothetical protein